MNRLHSPRRVSTQLAALVLIAAPLGCGTETQVAEVPAPPTIVVEAQPAAPGPMPVAPAAPAEMPPVVDPSVQQAAGEIKVEAANEVADAKDRVRQAEGDVKQAVEDVEGQAKGKVGSIKARARHKVESAEAEAKRKVDAIEADARKSAGDALDKLLPTPR